VPREPSLFKQCAGTRQLVAEYPPFPGKKAAWVYICSQAKVRHLLHLKPAHAGAAVEEAPQLLLVFRPELDPPLVVQQPQEGKAVQEEAHA
jgi:hypothetical protein